ncbi:hypothetical protein [Haloarcula regularis]|uniref:hypothetical protein n=1 Tax=Haloarcula regularis TaxID=3033392 RepID=UPI0023E8C3B2|nr:hypothetical protein [Halomicroarcula sp. SYNS111]
MNRAQLTKIHMNVSILGHFVEPSSALTTLGLMISEEEASLRIFGKTSPNVPSATE